MPRILGIDPGIRRTGYGIVDAEGARFRWVAGGVIRPPVDADLSVRLLHVADGLERLIAEHSPESCAFESVYHHRNPKSSLILGQAQAAAILAAARHGLSVALYSPSEVKQALTGSGRAAKQQVCFMVERILGMSFEGEDDDMSDALAVAICHAGRSAGIGIGARA